jgi:hypothetical protein
MVDYNPNPFEDHSNTPNQIQHPMPPDRNTGSDSNTGRDQFWYSSHCKNSTDLLNVVINNKKLESKFQLLCIDNISREQRPQTHKKMIPLIIHQRAGPNGEAIRNDYQASYAFEYVKQLCNTGSQCELGGFGAYDPSAMGGGISDSFATLDSSCKSTLAESSQSYTNQSQPSLRDLDYGGSLISEKEKQQAELNSQDKVSQDEMTKRMSMLTDIRKNDPHIPKPVTRTG